MVILLKEDDYLVCILCFSQYLFFFVKCRKNDFEICWQVFIKLCHTKLQTTKLADAVCHVSIILSTIFRVTKTRPQKLANYIDCMASALRLGVRFAKLWLAMLSDHISWHPMYTVSHACWQHVLAVTCGRC